MTRWIVPAIVAGLVALLAYGLFTPDRDPDSVLVGKPAPTFALQDLGGQTHALTAYAGQPVVVNFWASWCLPCREEAPMFSKVSQETAGRAQFLGIIYNDQPAEAKKFIDQYGLIYPSLVDPGSRTAIGYGVGQLPITFVVDRAGKVVYSKLGAVEEDELRAALKQAGL